MSKAFRLLDSRDAEWDAVVARTRHDIYHLRGYARVSETHETHPVRLAVAEKDGDVLVVPVIMRPVPDGLPGGAGLSDVTVPYGYPVPVSSSSGADRVRALAGVLWEGLRAAGAVSAFLRWHPLLGVPHASFTPEAEFVVHGEHVVVALAESGDDPVPSFRENHRRNVRGLLRSGFELRDDDPGDWAAFPPVYRQTMERAGADAYYLFPDAYFETMQAELGGHAHLISVIAPDGRVAASAILFVCGTVAQYHLSCTDAAFLASAPVKLAFVGMMLRARELGATHLNLGSGLGGARDSLFEFKAGFSALRAPFESARVVLDAARYAALAEGTSSPAGFFPAYRYNRP